jgi:hypothetical protein
MRYLNYLIFYLLSFDLFATAIVLNDKIPAYQYNSVWKRQHKTQFLIAIEEGKVKDGKVENVYFVFEDKLNLVTIVLEAENLAELNKYLIKFNEWHTKAKAKKIELSKEIGEFSVNISSFQIGKEWHIQKTPLKIKASFFTQKVHQYQFVLSFDKIQDQSNEFISYHPDEIYFNANDVELLIKAFDEKNIVEKVNAEMRKKQEINEEFK